MSYSEYPHHHPHHPCGQNHGAYYDQPKHYYFIKSLLSGHVLDIEGGSRCPGARVVTWPKNDSDSDNQLWYDDLSTGTIRSKLNDFCLDVEGNVLVVRPFQPCDANQQWMRSDSFIRNRVMQDKCLDISENKRESGAYLCSWDFHGGPNQAFDFVFLRRDFRIVSEMHGKVLDIEGASARPDAKLIVWPKGSPSAKNQIWYTDHHGVIRSALNDFALESCGNGQQIRMQPYSGVANQQWRFHDKQISNPCGECLDIARESHSDGAHVIAYHYKNNKNQHWRMEYV